MSATPIWRGHFDSNGNACLQFALRRQSNQQWVRFEGIIDTGFDGFLQLPLVFCLLQNLVVPPLTTGVTCLANGTLQQVFYKQLWATINGDAVQGACQLSPSNGSPILIGMDLLRRSQRALVISSTFGVWLPREQDLAALAQQGQRSLPPP